MRNLKKVLSLSLALVMLLGMMVVGAGAVETSFKDDSSIGDDYKEAVAVMSAIKVIEGKDDNNFDPSGTLKRGEAAKILVAMTMGNKAADAMKGQTKSAVFADMADHWAAGLVDACYSLGIVKGRDDNTYDPEGTLTGTEFAAMLLRAVGVEGEFTGSAWEANVRVAATKAGLSNVTSDNLPREAAAQMAFDGLIYSPSGEKTYSVTVGDKVYTFDSSADAYFFAQGQDDPKPAVKMSTAKDSLAVTVFGLSRGENTTDDFGRPTSAWTINGQTAVELVSSEPVLTYTETVTEKQLFADLGVTGRKESGDYYVVMDSIIMDGVEVANAVEKTSGSVKYWDADTSADKGHPNSPYNESVIIAKNANWDVRGSGNGTTIEVYATDSANHYKMIIVNEYVHKLAKSEIHTPKNADAYVEFTAPRVFDSARATKYTTDEFKADDVVLYTMANSKIASMKLAEVVEDATLTRKSKGVMVTDKGEFAYHTGVADSLTLGKSATLYLDSCNNIILTDTAPTTSEPTTFAYILGAAGEEIDETGVSAAGYKVQVKAVLDDGTVKVYNVPVKKAPSDPTALAKAQADSGNASLAAGDFYVADQIVWDASATGSEDQLGTDDSTNSLLKDKAFGYTLSDDGKDLTLIARTVATNLGAMTTDKINIGADDVDAGKTSLKTYTGVLVNSSTKFVVIDSTKGEAKVYTGKVSGNVTSAQVVVDAKSATTGVAKVVFTTANVSGVTTGVQLAYVDIATKDESLADDGKTTVYTYTAKTADVDDMEVTSKDALAASGVYEISSDGKVVGAAKTPSLAREIEGSGMMIANDATGTAAYRNYDKDTVNIVSGLDTNDWEGKMCVVDTDREGNVVTIFVVREPSGDTAVSDWKYTVADQVTIATPVGAGKALTSLASFTDADAVKGDCTASKAIAITGTAPAGGSITYKSANAATAAAVQGLASFGTNGAGNTNATTANYNVVQATVTAEDGTTATYYFVFKTA